MSASIRGLSTHRHVGGGAREGVKLVNLRTASEAPSYCSEEDCKLALQKAISRLRDARRSTGPISVPDFVTASDTVLTTQLR